MKPLFWSRIQIPNKVVPPPQPVDESSVDGAENGVSEPENRIPPSPPSSPPSSLWERLEEKEDVISEEFFALFARQVPTKAKPKLSTPSGKSGGKGGDDNLKLPNSTSLSPSSEGTGSSSKEKSKKKKVEPVQLLEQKRAHNVGILITSLRLDISLIEGALLNFNIESVVGTEKLQQIHEVAATQEELLLIENHLKKSPDVPLGKAERFLYDLSRIPQFHERVNCIMHELRFEELLVGIESTLSNFKLTCSSLTSKSSIKEIFAIILTVGM